MKKNKQKSLLPKPPMPKPPMPKPIGKLKDAKTITAERLGVIFSNIMDS